MLAPTLAYTSYSTFRAWALLLLAVAACGGGRSGEASAPIASLDTLPSPAGPGSTEPNLTTGPDGRAWLSWIEPIGDTADADSGSGASGSGVSRSGVSGSGVSGSGASATGSGLSGSGSKPSSAVSGVSPGTAGAGATHVLRFAVREGGAWSEARTIAARPDFWLNWADFPSLVVLPGGRLAAHWLQRSGAGTYDYDVRIAQSLDGGATWSGGIVPHRDGTRAEHGFVALYPAAGDSLGAIWLDGRKYAGAKDESTKEMQLAQTTLAAGGALGPERILDGRVCDCCQTAAAVTSRGPVVVYRDRSADEIRDIAISRLVDGAWTGPERVHADDWRIAACPVNGPAIAARGDTVAVAWFTGANDTARVRVAFSTDAGASFAPPIEVDDGAPAGRVDVELDRAGNALVSWIERVGGDTAEVRLRRVTRGGERSASTTITASSAARASGFPRMTLEGDDAVVLAWTVPGTPSAVRVARARLSSPR